MADAVEAVVGSLEIIDSRIAEWRITLPDTIADNASYGAVIVGGFRVPLSTIEVTTLPVSLAVNGEVVARATLYLALVTRTSMAMMESDGDLLIDGVPQPGQDFDADAVYESGYMKK